jgi:hypothetical protein
MKTWVKITPGAGDWETFSSHKLLTDSVWDYFCKKLVPESNWCYYNLAIGSSIWSYEHEDCYLELMLAYTGESIENFVVQLADVDAEDYRNFKNFLDNLCAEYSLAMESIT